MDWLAVWRLWPIWPAFWAPVPTIWPFWAQIALFGPKDPIFKLFGRPIPEFGRQFTQPRQEPPKSPNRLASARQDNPPPDPNHLSQSPGGPKSRKLWGFICKNPIIQAPIFVLFLNFGHSVRHSFFLCVILLCFVHVFPAGDFGLIEPGQMKAHNYGVFANEILELWGFWDFSI